MESVCSCVNVRKREGERESVRDSEGERECDAESISALYMNIIVKLLF